MLPRPRYRGRFWGGLLMVTGLLACPCHLPLTLPLLLSLLGGTAVGGFLAANVGLIYGLAAGYFVAALGTAWYFLAKAGARRSQCQLDPRSRPRP